MFVFKVFVSIAIVILCNIFCDEVSAKITISCPAFGTENAKSMPVMYPVPGDCSSFYVCANGELVKFACSNGTVFNPKSNVCDWPENVDCNSNTTEVPSTTSVPSNITTRAPSTMAVPTTMTGPQ